jgi:hypothetical protein
MELQPPANTRRVSRFAAGEACEQARDPAHESRAFRSAQPAFPVAMPHQPPQHRIASTDKVGDGFAICALLQLR